MKEKDDSAQPMSVVNRLRELGLDLPAIPEPVGNYIPCVRVGDLLFLAGQGPWQDGKWVCVGRVDAEVTLEQAYDGAKVCALGALAVMQRELGSLDKVKRIVRVTGLRKQRQIVQGPAKSCEWILGSFRESLRRSRKACALCDRR